MDEFLALAHHQESGLDVVIARLFNTVGPRQSGEYGMVIPRFVRQALAGETLEIHGDGSQTRCFCHVRDTIRALHGLMEHGTSGEIYNVGSANRIAIDALADEIVRAHRRRRRRSRTCPYDAGVRARDRGHAPPHPVDRQDQRGDRLGADPRRSTTSSST